MKNAALTAMAAIIIMAGQSLLWVGIVAFELPGAQSSLVKELKAELPEKIVPVLLAYFPQLDALTYENAHAYCNSTGTAAGGGFEVEGIDDEYVCGIIEDGFVLDTGELRLYLARQVVNSRLDGYSAAYSQTAKDASLAAIPLTLIAFMCAAAAAALAYLGTSGIWRAGFWYCASGGAWAAMNALFSLLCMLFAPGMIMGHAESELASDALGRDIFSLVRETADGKIGELFMLPLILFTLAALICGAAAVIFYAAGMVRIRK